jgi:succinate dehydrogenase / fumarate reductase flavoprotein subunit
VGAAADELTRYFTEGDVDPYDLQADLQTTMQSLVGIFRHRDDLSTAVTRLEELEARGRRVHVPTGGRAYNPGWDLCQELKHLVTCAQALTRAALLREESRGAHSRLDFPAYDDFWGTHNIVVSQEAGAMKAEPRPVVSVPELEPLVEARKAQEAKT